MNFAIFDVISCFFLLVLSLHGIYSGFVSEFFSRAAIFISLGIGVFFYKTLSPRLSMVSNNALFTDIISFLVLFIVTYLVIKLIQQVAFSFFQNDTMSNLDHALGFFWGIIEAVILVCLLYVIINTQTLLDLSQWLENSFCVKFILPITSFGEQYFQKIVPAM